MSLFKDKTLMITGGTGSFGNVVLNRFLKTDIGEIRVFSRDEKKQDDMRHDFQVRMPEVAEKIKTGELQIEKFKEEKKLEAEKKAEEIIETAKKNAENEKNRIIDSAKKEISDMIDSAGEKLSLSATTSDMYDKFIDEKGKSNE